MCLQYLIKSVLSSMNLPHFTTIHTDHRPPEAIFEKQQNSNNDMSVINIPGKNIPLTD